MQKLKYVVFLLSLLSVVVSARQPPDSLEQIKSNSSPVITTPSLPPAREAKHYSASIEATDNDSKKLYFRLEAGPKGLELSEKGKIKWEPGYEDAGKHPVNISVSDGESTTTKTYVLVVENNNREPVWETESLKVAVEGQSYSQQLKASDADGTALAYTLLEGPKDLTVSADGLINWSPDFFSAGKHTVKVAVSDGVATINESFRLEVENSNRPPQWQTQTLGNAIEGKLYEVQLAVTDLDKEELKFSLDSGPDGLKVSRSGQLKWTPEYNMAGTHKIKLSVEDGYGSVSQSLVLTVENNNRKPVVRSRLTQNLEEETEFSLVIEADDPDGNKLSYQLKDQPEGVILKKNVISWKPGYEQAGEYRFSLLVSDGEAEVVAPLVWQVKNTNRQPQWTTTELPQARENSPWQVQLQATDADRTALTYKLDSGPQGMQVTAEGKLSWIPDFETSGTHQIRLSVSDGEDSVEKSLTLKVENSNRKPEFTSQPPVVATETVEYQYKIGTDDPDREPLKVKLVQAPKAMTLNDNELIWTPGYEEAGVYDIELELSDAETSVQQKYKLKVENRNRLPVFEQLHAEEKQLSEDQPWKIEVKASDADRQKVVISKQQGPEGLTFKNNTLEWKPTFEQAGEHAMLLSASDGESKVDYSFILVVKNVNRLPVFTSKPVTSGKEVAAYHYTVEAKDPDRTELVYSLKESPKGMAITGKQISWTPDYEQSGRHTVVVQAADGEAIVEQSYVIEVENTNRKPLFNSAAQENAKENSLYLYKVDVSDPDRTPIELTLVKGPEGMVLNGNDLAWAPDYESAGSYPIILELTDKEATVRQGFNLLVENTNRLPVITSEPVLTAVESFPYSYHVTATDADRQSLAITLAAAPKGMVINNGLIEWIPAFDQQGKQDVVIDINDSEESVRQSFSIKVKDANRAPVIEPIDDHAVIAGDSFKYQIVTSDIDGDEIKIRIINGPKAMEVTSKGELIWKTSDKDIGSYTVIIKATDGDLESRSHFDLHVLQRE